METNLNNNTNKTPITNVDLIIKITSNWKQLDVFCKITLHSYISSNEPSTDEKMLHKIIRELRHTTNINHIETINNILSTFIKSNSNNHQYQELMDSYDSGLMTD